MYNEQQELLNEVYENYVNWWEYDDNSVNLSDKESEKWFKKFCKSKMNTYLYHQRHL
jgi:hypothetical protein